MADKIDLTQVPATITFTNLLTDAVTDLFDAREWNTGKALVGDPHIDEIVAAGEAEATISGEAYSPFASEILPQNSWKHGAIAVPLFGLSYQYVVLEAGQELELIANTSEAVAFYMNLASDALKVDVKKN